MEVPERKRAISLSSVGLNEYKAAEPSYRHSLHHLVMFGQFTDSGRNSNYAAEIEAERREKIKSKMLRNIERINSSDSSFGSVDDSTSTSSSGDSVERLRKIMDQKRESAKLRRERRIKREKKLREKMKKLDKLEKNLRMSSGNAWGGGHECHK